MGQLKQNSTATAGCRLYLTKALGIGVLSTAQKRGLLLPEDAAIAVRSMVSLNTLGETFGTLESVTAMTDVTGFGLLGHLAEMCEGSGLSAVLEFDKIPVIPSISQYLAQGCIPGGTVRNWNSYGHKVGPLTEAQRQVLADPQTSGGLLVAVTADGAPAFEQLLQEKGLPPACCRPFGRLEAQSQESLIIVK